jgi:hypothetical protein
VKTAQEDVPVVKSMIFLLEDCTLKFRRLTTSPVFDSGIVLATRWFSLSGVTEHSRKDP